MTQCNSLNIKLSNSQLNKLKSPIKHETGLVLRLSVNIVGDGETNFPHKLLLTNKQGENLCKAFAKNSSTDINLSKTQLSEIIQSGGFFGRLFGLLLKAGLPLIKNVIKPLAKSVLIPLGLTVAASAEDEAIHKKTLRSGNNTTTLIKSNDEMKDIIEIVKTLEDFGLVLKGVSKTIQNEAKEQKQRFFSMLLGTLGASLLRNILAEKKAIATSQGQGVNRAGEGIVRASY